jgi:hypothetical protein
MTASQPPVTVKAVIDQQAGDQPGGDVGGTALRPDQHAVNNPMPQAARRFGTKTATWSQIGITPRNASGEGVRCGRWRTPRRRAQDRVDPHEPDHRAVSRPQTSPTTTVQPAAREVLPQPQRSSTQSRRPHRHRLARRPVLQLHRQRLRRAVALLRALAQTFQTDQLQIAIDSWIEVARPDGFAFEGLQQGVQRRLARNGGLPVSNS